MQQVTADAAFRPSRFTIRVKLLFFVGSLLAAALGGMILVATLLYRDGVETQIQQYNLSLARLIGSKLAADFHNLEYGARTLPTSGSADSARPPALTAMFRKVHRTAVYVGHVRDRGRAVRPETMFLNAQFLRDSRQEPDFIEALHERNLGAFLPGKSARPTLAPLKTEGQLQLVGLLLPDSGPGAMLVYFEASRLLETFRATAGNDFFELYLVSPEGRVLVDTGRLTEQADTLEDRKDEPIVRQLLAGQLDNGSRRYVYRDKEYLASFQVLDFGGLGIVSRVPADRAFEAVLQLQRRNILIMVMVLATAFLFLYFFARGLNVPIRRLVDATRQVEAGNYRVDVRPTSRDEIGLLTTSFRSMARGLEERERLRGEMDVARRIQTALLPERDRIGPCAVAAIMQPAEEVGGDYYDLLETRAGETWLAIGDVSGHGVESGLIQMMTQTSIFSLLDATPGLSPSSVLRRVNSILRENISRLGVVRYITLSLLRLDENGLTFSGKHEDFFVHRSLGDRVETVETRGSWLGISEALGEFLEDDRVALAPGDTALFFTDGITEAADADLVLFGEERLRKSFARHVGLRLPEMLRAIVADVEAYQDRQRDDITVLALRLEGPSAAAPEVPTMGSSNAVQ